MERNGSSEEDMDVNTSTIDPLAEDHELKGQLLRKYSGYFGSLKQEFRKKRKKGKLPKEARQQLLDWWSKHYKWLYPSEAQKPAFADLTGLEQKQINNWFINQRKRHWKPSDNMQFVVMDAMHPHFYMDNIPFRQTCHLHFFENCFRSKTNFYIKIRGHCTSAYDIVLDHDLPGLAELKGRWRGSLDASGGGNGDTKA